MALCAWSRGTKQIHKGREVENNPDGNTCPLNPPWEQSELRLKTPTTQKLHKPAQNPEAAPRFCGRRSLPMPCRFPNWLQRESLYGQGPSSSQKTPPWALPSLGITQQTQHKGCATKHLLAINSNFASVIKGYIWEMKINPGMSLTWQLSTRIYLQRKKNLPSLSVSTKCLNMGVLAASQHQAHLTAPLNSD